MGRYVEDWTGIRAAEERESEFDASYPNIRAVLLPEYSNLPSETIEDIVESIYPNIDAEDLEGFLSKIGKIGKTIGKFGKKALPGVIQGATTGSALGPWGALAGGLAGGALSLTSKKGRRRSGGTAGRLPTRIGKAARVGSPAASQLLAMLGRPEVLRSLTSLALGGAGNRNIKVGNVNVPTGAITNTLRRLLERSEMELHEIGAGDSVGTPQYLLDSQGEFLIDPTDEDQRADLVLELLEHAAIFDHQNDDDFQNSSVFDDSAYGEEEGEDFDDEDESLLLYEGLDYGALGEDDELN